MSNYPDDALAYAHNPRSPLYDGDDEQPTLAERFSEAAGDLMALCDMLHELWDMRSVDATEHDLECALSVEVSLRRLLRNRLPLLTKHSSADVREWARKEMGK